MFVLRGGLSRGQFGLLNEGLYQFAYSGTKKIVERYLEVSLCIPVFVSTVCVCTCVRYRKVSGLHLGLVCVRVWVCMHTWRPVH